MTSPLLAALGAACLLAPRQETVDELLARGRDHLYLREIPQALGVFERAAELDPGGLETRLWLARGWIAAGRINDALDATDVLAAEHPGPAVDYLYGMAFAMKAQQYLSEGVRDTSVGRHFEDALAYLGRATEAEPARFRDGFLALAVAAWYASPPELTRARAAVERALAWFPEDPNAWFQKGRIAFSQYVSVQADEARAAEAQEHWSAASAAFGEAARRSEPPRNADARRLACEAHKQRGDLWLWSRAPEPAAAEYGLALGLAPDALDYHALQASALGATGFAAALEAGLVAFRASHAPGDPGDGALLWWVGYARFALDDNAGAERAFLECLEKRPEFANSWFWIALARYERADHAGAVQAFRTNHGLDPAGLLASVTANPGYNLPVVRWLMDFAVERDDLAGAVTLAELAAEAVRTDPGLWSAYARVERTFVDRAREGRLELTAEQAAAHGESALRASRRALALAPDDASCLNDTAVVLHRYLERDLDEARALYERACARAEAELARPDLAPELRTLYSTALHDARGGLEELARPREHDSGN